MEWIPTISKQSGPLYRQISDALESDIAGGRLRRGQQLPTHRALAGALGLDLTTVTRAYHNARHRGLLEARVGQGTFVSESTARVATDIADPVSIDLSMNVPPQPVEAAVDVRIEHGLAAIHKRSGLSSFLNYQEPGGNEQDREIIRSWLQPRVSGVTRDRLPLFSRSQPALFNYLLCFL